jgi:hypothetical protein
MLSNRGQDDATNKFGVNEASRISDHGVTAISFLPALPPFSGSHYAKARGVAQAEIPAPEKVYRAAMPWLEELPVVKILDKDDAKHFLEVTDDVQKASFKAESISQEKTAVIVKADVPKEEGKKKEYEKEREKELALRIIDNLCIKLNVKCTVTN